MRLQLYIITKGDYIKTDSDVIEDLHSSLQTHKSLYTNSRLFKDSSYKLLDELANLIRETKQELIDRKS